jgi:hypothetical protein
MKRGEGRRDEPRRTGMLKLKTILTALLISSTSMAAVAAAQPASVVVEAGSRDHRTNDYNYNRGYDRDDDGDGAFDYRRQIDPGFIRHGENHAWTVMTDDVSAAGDRQFIHLNGERAGAIRLDLERGSVYVYQIAVEDMNHKTTVVKVDRWMSAREDGTQLVELGARKDLNRVIVYTANGARASYRILAA